MSSLELVLSLVLAAPAAPEADWPQFRGPTGQGHATATALPVTWSESQNIDWKTPIPGRGWSSPVLGQGRIWMTTALDDERSLRAIAVDANTGRLLKNIAV